MARLLDLMPELATELQLLVKARYAAHDPLHPRPAPDPSGKTQRYLLRNRRRTELAAPEPR